RVAREITARATTLPVTLEPGESQRLDLFFPLAPSPLSLEVAIRAAGGGELIVLNTTELLEGLHLETTEDPQPE
ncbi:MAG: hypothetical protein R3348_08180, partial [Xanthomonadales bacterium]|nr:hypothetical protein [Xanthomonadales bacterium]